MSKIKTLASGIGWGTISTIAVTGFQLVFMAVMARLLNPTDFGLVAIANVSLRFFSYFAQLGTAPALIQKPTLEDGDIAAALTVSLGISCLFAALALVTAPLFEQFFAMPSLAEVIKILAINFIIGGFSVVSYGLLRRKAAFKALAIIEVVSYVIGYGLVGLAAAKQGYGVWALVAAFMTQNLLNAMLSYLVIRHSLRLSHTPAQRRHFLNYGGRYSVIGFLEFLTSNLDAMVIGKIFGTGPAGLYNRALLIANLPVQHPANILTKALFPVMSAVGDQHDKQAMGLQLSILLVGSYAFAVSLGVYVVAEDVVLALLGNKWLEAVPILKVLVWSVGPQFISHAAGVTLDSLGLLAAKLKIQFCMLLLLLALMAPALNSGQATDIATAVVIMEWLRVSAIMTKLMHFLRITIKDMLMIVICIGLVTASSCSIIYLLNRLLTDMPTMSLLLRLVAEIAGGGLGLMIGFFISRYLAIKLQAIRFLIEQGPIFGKFFPKLV
jgi:O-antigen/teichoic acid export membrane protein